LSHIAAYGNRRQQRSRRLHFCRTAERRHVCGKVDRRHSHAAASCNNTITTIINRGSATPLVSE
jgi:hypothetical protein